MKIELIVWIAATKGILPGDSREIVRVDVVAMTRATILFVVHLSVLW